MVVCQQGNPPQITTNHQWNVINMQDVERWVFTKASCSTKFTNTAWLLWTSHSLDKIVAFYQHKKNITIIPNSGGGLQWFTVVYGGLPASIWFHCLSSQILVVVCGGLIVPLCGGLWCPRFAVVWDGLSFSHTGVRLPAWGLAYSQIAYGNTPDFSTTPGI